MKSYDQFVGELSGQPSIKNQIKNEKTHYLNKMTYNENFNFLQTLDFSGNIKGLNLLVNFLLIHLGETRTEAILVQQAGTEDSYAQLPAHVRGKQEERMKSFLSLLRNNMAAEALDYLVTCQDLEEVKAKVDVPLIKRFSFPNSMFFFAFKAQKEAPELEDGEAYLPSRLLKILNSPT